MNINLRLYEVFGDVGKYFVEGKKNEEKDN